MTYDDNPTPADAEAAFYAAFEALDGPAMERVWASSPDVFCIHPGGPLLSGHEAVVASWLEIFSSADPPKMEFRLVHSQEHGDMAVHLVEERIAPGRSRSAEAAVVFSTNVYRRNAGGWRLLSHHASVPLVRRSESKGGRRLH